MKKLFSLILITFVGLSLQAQNKHGIGLHFGAYDFYGPQAGNYFFTDQYRYAYDEESDDYDTSMKSTLFWKPMVKISYWYEVNRWFDLYGSLSLSQLEYPKNDPDVTYINKYYRNSGGDREDKFLGELDARAHFNFLQRDSFIISPYVLAGLYFSYHNIYLGFGIPVGIGANIKVSNDFFINVESAYKIGLTGQDFNHLQHSIGFVYLFNPGYKAENSMDMIAPPPPPAPPKADDDE